MNRIMVEGRLKEKVMPARRLVSRARARALISRSFFFEERERPVISPFFKQTWNRRELTSSSRKNGLVCPHDDGDMPDTFLKKCSAPQPHGRKTPPLFSNNNLYSSPELCTRSLSYQRDQLDCNDTSTHSSHTSGHARVSCIHHRR